MKNSPIPYLLAFTIASLSMTGCQTTGADRFTQTDVDHDGKLTRDELNTYVVTRLFETRDANRDKQMTQAEWVVDNDPAQIKAFLLRDANKDGVVSRDEAIAYGRMKGIANQLLADADSDKDGTLSRAEVTAYYASKEGTPN